MIDNVPQDANEQVVCSKRKHWVVFPRHISLPIVLFLAGITQSVWLLSPLIIALLFVFSLIVATADFKVSKCVLTEEKFVGIGLLEWVKMKKDAHYNGQEVMRDDIEEISLKQDIFQRIFGGATVVVFRKQGSQVKFKDIGDAAALTHQLQSG